MYCELSDARASNAIRCSLYIKVLHPSYPVAWVKDFLVIDDIVSFAQHPARLYLLRHLVDDSKTN